ncbi:MAG: immunoglobulin domain-containing protein, partial [Cytophagales bacterium]|nr:immunoglobulin domain-containing protein [Cytophagales bacterium]
MQSTFSASFRATARRPFAALLWVLACCSFFHQPAFAQRGAVSEDQLAALRAIYEATDGAHWRRNDNWLSDQPVDTWYGVTVRGGVVTGLDLAANNLTGTLPAALGDLYALQDLHVQNNRLAGLGSLPYALENLNCAGNRLAELPELPELLTLACAGNALTALPELPATLRSLACDTNGLAALPALPERLSLLSCRHNRLAELPELPGLLEQFDAAHNRLTFEDVAPVVAQLSPFSYTLTPQDSLARAARMALSAGDSLILAADGDNHPGNRYQWFRNGKALGTASANPRYVVRNVTTDHAGTYTCVVTNAVLTEPSGLTLHRRPVVVTVEKKTSFQPAPAKTVDAHGMELYPNPSKATDKLRLANTKSERVALSIKAAGDFTEKIGYLKPGATVYLDGPHGAFTIDRHNGPGFVFIGAGVGITPLMSTLRTMADRSDPRPCYLLFGNREWESVAFREEIEKLKDRLNLE